MKQILGLDGKPIVLNAFEKNRAIQQQAVIKNAGFEVDTTTLTTIMKRVIEQKFYEIPFADFVPVRVGEGAWSTNLLTYTSQNLGDDFATGIMNLTPNANGRIAAVDAQIGTESVKVGDWAKTFSWTLFELQHATRSGNWDVVTIKEKARKKNWDLGIQKLAFLGLKNDTTNYMGLLNQTAVTANTAIIPKFIKTMTAAEFITMAQGIYQAYRVNSAYTAKPTHFILPEYDFNGLAAPHTETMPIKTKLQLLKEIFSDLTGNPNFQILPCSYANKSIHTSTANYYTLLNYDEDSVRLDIPVNYSITPANSMDNFSFQSIGYGQFTGVKAYRPKEMLYFTHTVADA